ncbi:MAG: aminomethyl-transferring glycine dehydrogenase subunit GcvPA [Halobacteriales archaeon]
MTRQERGSPFAPHRDAETAAMLSAVGADDQEELFDIPEEIRYTGDFGIEAHSEREVREAFGELFARNDDLTEFLGRGHYDHYVPSLVDHLADRSEFLTSYTQYQPEVTQGFLQALFEYQSMFVELTGLEIVNASMYDHATALGEAALLAGRVREASGERILVPDILRPERMSVLENYVDGAGFSIETYPTEDANVDIDGLEATLDADAALVYVESPTTRGTLEESLPTVADLAHEHDALACLGSDPVALSLLEAPADQGIDVVVGEAATLGMPTAYGMGLGVFACREDFLRRTPGRLVGVSEDENGTRSYTLTLQTREQHIRRERATSNICTNQAWVALRTAMHIASLGPSGLVDLATTCASLPTEVAARVDDVKGIKAPAHDRPHFREFVARTDQPAPAIAADLEAEGYAVHAIDEHELQICLTETNADAVDDLVATLEEVA